MEQGHRSSEGNHAMKAMKKALLVVHMATFMTEIGQLADHLSKGSRYSPELMLYPYPLAGRNAKRFAAVTCLDHLGRPFSATTPSMLMSLPRRVWGLLARYLPPLDLLAEVLSLKRRRRQVESILRDRKPDVVVIGGDMVGYDTAVLIDVCHRQNIPVATVPSTMSNGLEQAEVYSADRRHFIDYPLNRRLATRHPNWLYVHNGKELLRERGARGLAMEWLRLAPPLPWIFNSGNADAIAIESEAMKSYYLDAGLPADRLVVTGSPSDDAIFEVVSHAAERRAALCSSLGLRADRPILLSALPPDSLYMKGGRPKCDFKTYADLVEFWIGSLDAVPDVNKIVCVHPSVSAKTVREFETSDLKVASIPTAQLVPLCDVYVASVSSTIRWAIACGKPVINYDVYRYRYTDFNGLGGVLTTEEKSGFAALLGKVAKPAYRGEVAGLQRRDASRYGNFDGLAANRIVDLMDDLIADRTPKLSQSIEHIRELMQRADEVRSF